MAWVAVRRRVAPPPDQSRLASNAQGFAFEHDEFDAVLSRFVDQDERVDYSGLRNDRSRLDGFDVVFPDYDWTLNDQQPSR